MTSELNKILKPKKEMLPIDTEIKEKTTKLDGIKAIIFDIYGTILISGSGDIGNTLEHDYSDLFKKAFARCGVFKISNHQIEYIKKHFFSLIKEEHEKLRSKSILYPEIDIREIWKKLLIDAYNNVNLTGALSIKANIIAATYESITNPVYPMPNLKNVLLSLRKKDIKLGILSNAQFYTPLIFESLYANGLKGLGFNEELCVFSYREKIAKPDSTLFEIMIKKLSEYSIKPNESLFVGNDMLNDILPAKENNFKTGLFAGDKRSLRLRKDIQACKTIQSNVILKSLEQILICI